MIHGCKVLGVIPARGGSKRCPRKNLLPFRGKPLLQWAIESARDSDHLDHIVVSTEDAEIEHLARNLECEVVRRPFRLATDEAMNEDVLRHVLVTHETDWVVLLQPTSPLRTGLDIDKALETVQNSDHHVCISYNQNGKRNGAVYVSTAHWLKNGGNFSMYYAEPYFMPSERSLDIDYPDQFNG